MRSRIRDICGLRVCLGALACAALGFAGAATAGALGLVITGGPSGTITSNSATFTFQTKYPAAFTCSLTGWPTTTCGTGTTGTAPYPSLTNAAYDFTVIATYTNFRPSAVAVPLAVTDSATQSFTVAVPPRRGRRRRRRRRPSRPTRCLRARRADPRRPHRRCSTSCRSRVERGSIARSTADGTRSVPRECHTRGSRAGGTRSECSRGRQPPKIVPRRSSGGQSASRFRHDHRLAATQLEESERSDRFQVGPRWSGIPVFRRRPRLQAVRIAKAADEAAPGRSPLQCPRAQRGGHRRVARRRGVADHDPASLDSRSRRRRRRRPRPPPRRRTRLWDAEAPLPCADAAARER